MDPKTGTVSWAQTGIVNTSAEQAEATFLVMGKNILCLTDGGELLLYAADAKAFREISHGCREKLVQSCLYVGGKLYLRDRTELRCVELK